MCRRPVFNFQEFVCQGRGACKDGFAVHGFVFFSLVLWIHTEVVRSTLLKIRLSLPFGESGPFNDSVWFDVENLRFYRGRVSTIEQSRTYPFFILYRRVLIRPRAWTILRSRGWTQEQNFHGIGVPGGRFFNFQNLGCVRAPSIAGKLSRCAE